MGSASNGKTPHFLTLGKSCRRTIRHPPFDKAEDMLIRARASNLHFRGVLFVVRGIFESYEQVLFGTLGTKVNQ